MCLRQAISSPTARFPVHPADDFQTNPPIHPSSLPHAIPRKAHGYWSAGYVLLRFLNDANLSTAGTPTAKPAKPCHFYPATPLLSARRQYPNPLSAMV